MVAPVDIVVVTVAVLVTAVVVVAAAVEVAAEEAEAAPTATTDTTKKDIITLSSHQTMASALKVAHHAVVLAVAIEAAVVEVVTVTDHATLPV